MNLYNCDRRRGYGDSAEEAANLLSAPTRNPWQVGNTNCNAAGMAEGGTGQTASIFQGFLGGRAGYGGMQPTSAGVHARWDLIPIQLEEIRTSGCNQRVDQEEAKWNMNPCTRLQGQPDDDELIGFSVDQRCGRQSLPVQISGSCNVIYKECQKNQALDAANSCVDGCEKDGQEALQCMASGCHRSYHRSVRVPYNGKEVEIQSPDDLHTSLSKIESIALNLMEATGRALPLLAREPQRVDDLTQEDLDTVIKISIENLDHISKVTRSTVKCIGILQTAGNTNQDHGRLSSEVSPVSTTERRKSQLELNSAPKQLHQQGNKASALNVNGINVKPKRKRTQFTDEQRRKMKAYAEHAGWTIVGQRKENIATACKDIGVTPKTLKYWIHNAKQKLKRSNEPPL
ncbi:hypothetical protein KC19_1G125300 [Ceratodon purpureus]|uniref:Homeobox domain-containing protein n=1 Tax=Ceratodon purpureus TaxID=3225 RepID=A0A8T0J6C8_CERPU|nr:hypothetical protein KC19_1G125300 [Ceratodon purpureus]